MSIARDEVVSRACALYRATQDFRSVEGRVAGVAHDPTVDAIGVLDAVAERLAAQLDVARAERQLLFEVELFLQQNPPGEP